MGDVEANLAVQLLRAVDRSADWEGWAEEYHIHSLLTTHPRWAALNREEVRRRLRAAERARLAERDGTRWGLTSRGGGVLLRIDTVDEQPAGELPSTHESHPRGNR